MAQCLISAGAWNVEAAQPRIDAADWWYRVRFPRPAAPAGVWVLGFDGLASDAQVWLNGALLLASENMFLAHECVLDERLAPDNELLMRFRSLDELLKVKRARPRWRVPMLPTQQLRWHRTTLLGRTPGWSPPAPPVGPWRPVWLEARSRVAILELSLRSGVEENYGWVEIRCAARGIGGAAPASADLRVSRDGQSSWALEAPPPARWGQMPALRVFRPPLPRSSAGAALVAAHPRRARPVRRAPQLSPARIER